MSPSESIITVRDWRRGPPLRLRVTKKLDIHWCWIKCTRCPHMRAVAIAPFIIRWGPDGWRDMLRQYGRCSKCGQKGVTLQHSSWDGSDTGWAPMPDQRDGASAARGTPVDSRLVSVERVGSTIGTSGTRPLAFVPGG